MTDQTSALPVEVSEYFSEFEDRTPNINMIIDDPEQIPNQIQFLVKFTRESGEQFSGLTEVIQFLE